MAKKIYYPTLIPVKYASHTITGISVDIESLPKETNYSKAFQKAMDIFEEDPEVWSITIVSDCETVITLKRSTSYFWYKKNKDHQPGTRNGFEGNL